MNQNNHFSEYIPFNPYVFDKGCQDLELKLGLKNCKDREILENVTTGFSFDGKLQGYKEIQTFIMEFKVNILRVSNFLFLPFGGVDFSLTEGTKMGTILPKSSLSSNTNIDDLMKLKLFYTLSVSVSRVDAERGYVRGTMPTNFFPNIKEELDLILKIDKNFGGFTKMFNIKRLSSGE